MATQRSDDDGTLATSLTPASSHKHHHLLHIVFMVDTTGSMQTYLDALKRSLGQVCSLLSVLYPDNNNASDVSIICYEDYGDGPRLLRKMIQKPYQELYKFCNDLKPGGGGDMAEASKTALNCLSKLCKNWKQAKDSSSTTIVFHYTDAPPHHKLTNPSGSNRPEEIRALQEDRPGYDWCKIARRFQKASSLDNNRSSIIQIYTIVPKDSPAGLCGSAFYALLGELIVLPVVSADEITKTTMGILLQLTGQETDDATFQRVAFQRHDEVMARLLAESEDEDVNEDTFPELNTDACKEPTISSTPMNTRDLEWTIGNTFSPLPSIKKDISALKSQFKSDPAYRDTVFESMENLVNPENVMALTTNELFGRLWRLVCTRREDDRLPHLQAKMGDCCVTSKVMTEANLTVLKDWLEASYDNAEEINDAIKSNQQEGCRRYYVMDAFAGASVPDVNGLRSLARSPCPDAMASVQNVLSHIMLVSTDSSPEELPVDDDGNLRFLPESFDDYQLFTMLPHLMQAGTQYSLKPAAVLAILCCKSTNSLLESRAKRFLQSICGKWLPPVERIDRAEIISYEFCALMANCHVEGAFTDEERQFFRRLHEIWRYRRGRFENFEVVTALSPTKPMLLPDVKEKCRRCGQWTSSTLMNSKHVCGICVWMSESKENVWKRPHQGEDYFVEQTESYMVECTACQVIYAVLGPADLNVPPKCHYCRGLHTKRRSRAGAPYHRCGCCKAKWCNPELEMDNDETCDYACPVCVHAGATAISEIVPPASTTCNQVSLNQLVDQNPLWVKKFGFRPKGGSIIFSSTKLYQVLCTSRDPLLLEPGPNGAVVPPLLHKAKRVLNEESLLKTVKERIAVASFKDSCQLCFEEMAVEKLCLACGQCTNRCCVDCLKSWYGQNSPGCLFVPSHDMCPFCRLRPRYQILSLYNKDACGIIGQSRRKGAPLRLRADWYYGWCTTCWKVAYAMERSCAEGVPVLKDFVCEECEEKAQLLRVAAEAKDEGERTQLLLQQAKPCPGCQMLTTHLGGCSHMTCANCHVHWCWQCDGEFHAKTGQDVYNHMRSEHGGYGWIGDEDDDDYD